MPVVTPSCQPRRRARKGCDEECLRRIAARLCRLDECSTTARGEEQPFEGKLEVARVGADDCYGEKSTCSPGAGRATSGYEEVVDGCCGEASDADVYHEKIGAGKTKQACSTEKKNCCEENTSAVPETCCSGESKTAITEDCRGDSSGSKMKTETCCSTMSESKSASVKACCDGKDEKTSGNESHAPGIDCKKGCCSSEEHRASTAIADSARKNTCCDLDEKAEKSGGTQVCVDECCDDRLEPRDLEPSVTCSDHLRTAFDRYESLLRMGMCLCRRVQEQLGFSCCAMGPDGMPLKSKAASLPKQDPSTAVQSDLEIHSRCSQSIVPSKASKTQVSARPLDSDVENAAAREHVVLSVSGMTCTGCSRKMMNVMDNIPGISNNKVTFVTETAEFDLDAEVADTASVLARIEKETGFKVSRIVSGYQHLDLLMSSATADQFTTNSKIGVIAITRLRNNAWRITYDPHTIGARSLLGPEMELAPPSDNNKVAEGKRRLRHMAWAFTLSLVLTIPVVVLNWAPNPVPRLTRSIVSLVLATLVQGIAISEFYIAALKSLVYSRVIEMDMLVVISVTAAYLYSLVAFALEETGYDLEQEAFFETAALLTTLILLGRLMSTIAKVRAVSAVSMRSLQANSALLLQPDGSTNSIDARLLQFGDILRVGPHSNIVTDGKVVSGESAADESMLTGESTPVRKEPGDAVIAGTVNGPGTIDVKITRLPGENSITDIANLVENAVAAKPRIQDLADKVASWFIPAVIGISIVVFAVWMAVAVKVRGENAGGAIGTAVTYAIAVLAISCPCALGLAVPMVLVIAGGVAAKSGVIIKAADAIERGYQATDVIFDKTGTLTTGTLEVEHEEVIMDEHDGFSIISLAYSLVENNDHPVARAIASHLAHRTTLRPTIPLKSKLSIPGAGIQAQLNNNTTLKAGNPYWLGIESQPKILPLLSDGKTTFALTINSHLALIFTLRSHLRPQTPEILHRLQSHHQITCHIVSGDNPKAVEIIAKELNIPLVNIASRCSPAGKQFYVENIQDKRRKVLFVGDGINDAVAIAQADIGVQIFSSAASEITGAVADVVLLGETLEGVVTLLELSQRAFRRIRFNFLWTGVYNFFAIGLAAGVFEAVGKGVRVEPGYAGLGEIVSVGPVILGAGSLVWKRGRRGRGR